MSSDDSPPSAVIGPYRFEAQIGTGGMGAVYRAWDERLSRPVAMKRVRSSVSDRGHLASEARAIAQLSHPNIVQVYDLLEHEDDQWIVMELVQGMTLRKLLRRGLPPIEEVTRYALDVAKGLAAAHVRGIVHRDLKSENVMITDDGTAKILDFGLALAPVIESRSEPGADRVIGTPRAMSPEQAMGREVDARSDLFSFGSLLYECVAGISPFVEGTTAAHQVMYRVCSFEQEPLQRLVPSVPREISSLVDRLLEKEPSYRPQTAEEVVLTLQRAQGAPGDSTMRVLFVDDEPDLEPLIRQWFRHRFKNERYEVVFAGHGVEALEVLRAEPSIQLVLTDLNMPEMDGLTLLDELGKLDRSFVSVVVSAYGDITNIRSAMNRGAFDFLTKPFDFKDLEVTLEKASRQATSLREGHRLREENRLLDERNRVIRVAFSRYLQGDPELSQVFEPLIDQLRWRAERHLTLLSLRVEGFDELPDSLGPQPLYDLTSRFLRDLTQVVQRHQGTILELDGASASIGFGLAGERHAQQAMDCAVALRRVIEALSGDCRARGGPELVPKIMIDSGTVTIEDSGDLSGQVVERAERWVRDASGEHILVHRNAVTAEHDHHGSTGPTMPATFRIVATET